MGHSKKPDISQQQTTPYNLDYLNADVDLRRISDGLKSIQSARICLYGRSGTGKSGFAQYLANFLDKALLSKKGSDLLGMYVGQTEKQIASMFEQAEQEGAILLLDEGDSFLRDRTGVHQQWEVTQVNELLIQMEKYEGIFIISTNLIENLDVASLRRFDFKIQFDYMRPEQSWAMFQEVMKTMGITNNLNEKALELKIKSLQNLTPGDFATIIRKSKVLGDYNENMEMAEDLFKECQTKKGGVCQRIGFT